MTLRPGNYLGNMLSHLSLEYMYDLFFMKVNVQISPVLQQDTNAVYGEDGRWKHCKKCKEAHSHSNICPCTKGVQAIAGTQMNPHFTIVWHNCDRGCWSACRHQQICKYLHTVGHFMIQKLDIRLLNQLSLHTNWKTLWSRADHLWNLKQKDHHSLKLNSERIASHHNNYTIRRQWWLQTSCFLTSDWRIVKLCTCCLWYTFLSFLGNDLHKNNLTKINKIL